MKVFFALTVSKDADDLDPHGEEHGDAVRLEP
jgi:hypothetical protein